MLLLSAHVHEALATEPVSVAIDATTAPGTEPECVALPRLQRETEATLGRRVFVPQESADVLLNVAVTSPPRASISLTDRDGHPLGRRVLEAQSCAELSDALVLALSLMLDFSKQDVDSLRAQADADARAEPQPSGATAPPQPQTKAPPSTRPSWRPRFSLDGRLGIGFAPTASLGIGLAAGIGAPLGQLLELNAGYWLPEKIAGFEGSATLQVWELGATACPGLGTAAAQLCATVHGGVAHARGSEFPTNRASNTGHLRAGIELRSQWALGPTFIEAHAAATGALLGYRVLLQDSEGAHELFQSAKVLFSAALGYGFFLP